MHSYQTLAALALSTLVGSSMGQAAARPSMWGFATSALQIEGAWNVSKGATVWDTFLMSGSAPASFGDVQVTADHYNRYKDDLKYLKDFGANAYRFSISWARVFPNCSGTPNEEALVYYSDLIDTILANGAEPVGTMWHWDLPQACFDQYGGWTSPNIVRDFHNYAVVLLSRYSNRVKYWLTLNEPSNICYYAYNAGTFAPNVKMGLQGQYLCGHYSILATAYVIQTAAQSFPDVKISLPLVMSYGEPRDPNSQDDIQAGVRSMEFTGGWFLDPFLTGDYPASMRADPTIGQYLPTFSGAEKAALRLGLPFIALNYYTSYYVYSDPTPGVPGLYSSTTTNQAGVDIGPVSGIEWQRVFPQGLKKALLWLHNRYPNSRFWLSEIGCAGPGESTKPLSEVPNDDFRIAFLSDHLNAVYEAIKEGNMLIDAILVWSLMDNWEWQFGYGPRFGVVGVDYTGGTLTRTVKKSALWLKEHFSYMPQKAPLTTSDHHNTTHSGQGVTGTNKKNSAFRVTESRSLLLGLGALCIFYATLF